MGLIVLNVVLLLLYPATYLFDWLPVRFVLGFLVLFFIPGYAWLAALYVKRDELEWLERLGLSIPLSIATVTLTGLGLALTPLGLSLESVLVSITLIVGFLSATAFWRRNRLPVPERRRWTIGPNPFTRIQMALIGIATAAALGWTGSLLMPPPQESFTEFYLLDANGMAENYQEEVVLGKPLAVETSIVNREGRTYTYWISVYLGDTLVGQMEPVTLESGKVWKDRVQILVDEAFMVSPTWQKLEVQLRRGSSQREPHSVVYLWIKVMSGESGTRLSTGDP